MHLKPGPGDGVRVTFEGEERVLIRDIVRTVIDTVKPAAPQVSDDPFAQWEAEIAPTFRHDDPVHERLFPAGMSAEEEGADDFRAFSRSIASQQHLADAEIVLADLDAASRGRVVVQDHLDAWLRTLNIANLILAERIGIVDEISAGEVAEAAEDPDDPRSFIYFVHTWLSTLIQGMIEVR